MSKQTEMSKAPKGKAATYVAKMIAERGKVSVTVGSREHSAALKMGLVESRDSIPGLSVMRPAETFTTNPGTNNEQANDMPKNAKPTKPAKAAKAAKTGKPATATKDSVPQGGGEQTTNPPSNPTTTPQGETAGAEAAPNATPGSSTVTTEPVAVNAGEAAGTTPPPAGDAPAGEPAKPLEGETLAQMKKRLAAGAKEIQKAQKAQAAADKKKADEDKKALALAEANKPIVASDRPVADIVADYIKPLDGGLGYEIAAGLPVDQWVTVVRHLDRQSEAINFMVGDLLVYGEKTYGKTYEAATAATGRSMKTLANWKSVCKGVGPEIRTLELSFTHHEAVSSLPAETQKTLLDRAVAEKMPVAELRKLANDAKPPKLTPPAPPASTTTPAAGSTGVPAVKLEGKAKEEYDKIAEKADDVLLFLKSKGWINLPQKETNALESVLAGIAEKFAEAKNAGRFTNKKK